MRTNPLQGRKIVIDGRFIAPHRSGISRYTRELIKSILDLKLGIDLKLIVRSDEPFDPELKKILDTSSEKVEVIGTSAVHYSAKEQTEYLKLLNGLNADLVHFTNFNHPVRYKKPFVVTIHDLTLHNFPNKAHRIKQWVYAYIMRHAATRARVIFAVSEFTKRDIVKNYQVANNKIQVTYNGIDLERFRPISNSKRLQEVTKKYKITKPFILYVGQWMEHKNIFRLIDAFHQFNANPKFRDQYQLVLTGQPRNYDEYKNRIAELKIEKSIILTGFVDDDDLPALYNAAKLFVFPSLSEGFGIPPVEAMACGVPVIASNTTSLPEILGHAALYFNPLEIDSMVKALEKGLTDINLQKKLTQAGREQAAKFSWKNTAQKTVDGYTLAL